MNDDWQPGQDPAVASAEDVEGIGGVEPFIGPPGTCFGEGWLPEMADRAQESECEDVNYTRRPGESRIKYATSRFPI